MASKAKAIADYLVSEGTERTTSGNYIFSFDDIEELFSVTVDDKLITDIEKCLDYEVVATLDTYDGIFDLYFYTDYCPNCEEVYDE